MTKARTATTFSPPVMEARRWLDGVDFSQRPLINVSQAAPVDPPPMEMRQAMAQMIVEQDETHLYGPVLGLPALRAEVADQWSGAYGGSITPDQVAITSGCNQAFAAAIAALCGEGDEVILPVPYYFNHRMWLDMAGVKTVPLPPQEGLIPSANDAEMLISARTRAIVLVSPNNPGGVEYPAQTIVEFATLARMRGLALIIDETYRDFDSRVAPAGAHVKNKTPAGVHVEDDTPAGAQHGHAAPHPLFQDPQWDETLIQLYSFSKAYRLTGHRVGAIVASAARLAEVEKFLDTVTICPNQLGQHAALWGMRNLGPWLAAERLEILDRRAAIEEQFPRLATTGWKLEGCGAYFAYVKHPFNIGSDDLARELVQKAGVLTLPGTMFMPAFGETFMHASGETPMPASSDTSTPQADGSQHLRIAFANVDRAGITALFDRLVAFSR